MIHIYKMLVYFIIKNYIFHFSYTTIHCNRLEKNNPRAIICYLSKYALCVNIICRADLSLIFPFPCPWNILSSNKILSSVEGSAFLLIQFKRKLLDIASCKKEKWRGRLSLQSRESEFAHAGEDIPQEFHFSFFLLFRVHHADRLRSRQPS